MTTPETQGEGGEAPGLVPPSPEDARILRDGFLSSGYEEESLVREYGTAEPPFTGDLRFPRMLECARAPGPLGILARWFLLGLPVSGGEAGKVLRPGVVERLVRCGMLAAEGEELRPRVAVGAVGRTLVVSDPSPACAAEFREDQVRGLNPSARRLLDLTIRRPVASTLDLGTGCGVQAFLAAGHSERVTATDVNPRATTLAALGARLNGIENMECLTGDRFEPVRGRRFSLILSNPPFILSPVRRNTFSDNGRELDSFCRDLVREIPAHLEEGGFAQMILEWVSVGGEDWRDRIRPWFEGSGCDVWALKGYTREAWQYTVTRMLEASQAGTRAPGVMYDEWMDYYRSRNVTAVHGGALVLRRRSGRNWTWFEELEADVTGPCGEAILRRFRTRDLLESLPSDEALLDLVLRPAGELRIEQDLVCREGEWTRGALRLRQEAGLRRTVGTEPDVVRFLTELDGRTSLGDLARATAERFGAAPEEVAAEMARVARTLLERGFLEASREPPGRSP